MGINDSLKNEIVKRLQKINPARIFLFGSFASGKPTKDSDIDLLIIKEKISSKIREAVEARRTLKGILMPFDMIVASQEEFDFYKDQINTIYFEADKKGILLYERK
ncbi:MAG: nucleotidyltransferase domain-containing protein [Thermodesulfovibrionales bacterium]|nr:nucleotidyltransferase domain-containing protein [Thermodesulfovibrionales bacterium]